MKYLETNGEKQAFIDAFDTFLFDCDGVLWHGSTLIKGVAQVLETLQKQGKKTLFVSNNSTKSRDSYLTKFIDFGIDTTVDHIFGSSYAAAYYLKNTLKFPSDKRVYVIGMQGICDELHAQGISYLGSQQDNQPLHSIDDIGEFVPDESIGAVLVGFDLAINYRKYAKAFTYLKSNSNCVFLATNTDSTYPSHGTVFPGTGALVSVLTTALQRDPIVLGKPSQTMLDVIVDKYHLDRERTCMVGDRLDTDIAFGHLGKLGTLLVMTGVTTEADLVNSTIRPDYKLQSLADLI